MRHTVRLPTPTWNEARIRETSMRELQDPDSSWISDQTLSRKSSANTAPSFRRQQFMQVFVAQSSSSRTKTIGFGVADRRAKF